GLGGKGDLAGIGNGESARIGWYRREIFQRTFRREGDEFGTEAVLDEGDEPAVLGPAEIIDRSVHTRASEVLCALLPVMGEDEVVRRGAVFAAANESHLLAIRGD